MARPSHPPSLFPLSDLPLVFLSTISKALTIASLLRRSLASSSKALIRSETILLVTSLESPSTLAPESFSSPSPGSVPVPLPSLSASVSSGAPEPSPSLDSVPVPLPSLSASVSPSLPDDPPEFSPLDVELFLSSFPSSAEDGEFSILLVASEPP